MNSRIGLKMIDLINHPDILETVLKNRLLNCGDQEKNIEFIKLAVHCKKHKVAEMYEYI